jgi:hypothetical protein
MKIIYQSKNIHIMEEWKSVPGFDVYESSTLGNIRRKGKLLKLTRKPEGYLKINTCINGKRITQCVHRLVALAHIPNPENKPDVDHVNGEKTDNRVANLRWATTSENLRNTAHRKSPMYGIRIRSGSYEVRVTVHNDVGRTIGRYPTLEEAQLARDAALHGCLPNTDV